MAAEAATPLSSQSSGFVSATWAVRTASGDLWIRLCVVDASDPTRERREVLDLTDLVDLSEITELALLSSRTSILLFILPSSDFNISVCRASSSSIPAGMAARGPGPATSVRCSVCCAAAVLLPGTIGL